ncbi:Retrovirus-related Pol polyprotein from transposon 17.6 [Ixodes scapularis]
MSHKFLDLQTCIERARWRSLKRDTRSAQRQELISLRRRLQTPPVLGHFDQDADTEIHTDASNAGLGAVLVQVQEGTERVIAYASRTLSKAERNYSTTEKECLAVVWAITKFRPYLYGSPFRVVTDHHSLCWLANLKDLSGRLARWSLRLQEFNMTVVYKSGRKHSDADCLSRAPVETPSGSSDDDDDECFLGAVNTDDMARRQRDYPDLRALMEHLEGRVSTVPRVFSRALPTFAIRQGVLYKENFGDNNSPWLLVIPTDLREEIFQACHDDPTSGHLGYSRTLARIREKYYWPKLPKTVHHYTRSCHECQRRKKPPTKPAGLLQPIPPPTAPIQQIGMDLLGPFPPSTQGNRWIIVATDYLTRGMMSSSDLSGERAKPSLLASFTTPSMLLCSVSSIGP